MILVLQWFDTISVIPPVSELNILLEGNSPRSLGFPLLAWNVCFPGQVENEQGPNMCCHAQGRTFISKVGHGREKTAPPHLSVPQSQNFTSVTCGLGQHEEFWCPASPGSIALPPGAFPGEGASALGCAVCSWSFCLTDLREEKQRESWFKNYRLTVLTKSW